MTGTPKKEPLIDNRGNLIAPGKKVAYNLSGEIAIGIVESATPAILIGYSYHKRASIKINVLHPAKMTGKTSIVKCPRNVMVIFEDDHIHAGTICS